MIVKNGRLYLWQNKISGQPLIIKVGTGSGSTEYVEVDQTALQSIAPAAIVQLTSEDEYNVWNNDPTADVWHNQISDIAGYTSTPGDIASGDIFYGGDVASFYYFDTQWNLKLEESIYVGTSGTDIPISGEAGNRYFKTDTLKLYINTAGTWTEETPTTNNCVFYDDIANIFYYYDTTWHEGTYLGTSGVAAPVDGTIEDDGRYYFKTDTLALYLNTAGTWAIVTTAISDEMFYDDIANISYVYTTDTWNSQIVSGKYLGTSGTSVVINENYYLNTGNLTLYQNEVGIWTAMDTPTIGDIFHGTNPDIFYCFLDDAWTSKTSRTYQGTAGTDPAEGGSSGDYYFKTDTLSLYLNTDDIWELLTPTTAIVITNKYLFADERKIVIYAKIETLSSSFELAEIGLFVKATAPVTDIMISRNLLHKQTISTTESKIIKYTINI